jgi:hypothetical protein
VIRDVLERDKPDAIRAIVREYIVELHWLPDSISVTELMSRSDVEAAYRAAFVRGHLNDWEAVANWLAARQPSLSLPIQTENDRAACLAAYLDLALGE